MDTLQVQSVLFAGHAPAEIFPPSNSDSSAFSTAIHMTHQADQEETSTSPNTDVQKVTLNKQGGVYHAVKKQNILLFMTSNVLLFEAPSQS